MKSMQKISKLLAMTMVLIVLLGSTIASDSPPPVDWIPPNLDATPSSQAVTSSDGYKAEWEVCIYEGVGYYTLEIWFGEGSYLRRQYVSADSCLDYSFYYDNLSNGTYYQTWKITGQGGPDYDYTSINRQ